MNILFWILRIEPEFLISHRLISITLLNDFKTGHLNDTITIHILTMAWWHVYIPVVYCNGMFMVRIYTSSVALVIQNVDFYFIVGKYVIYGIFHGHGDQMVGFHSLIVWTCILHLLLACVIHHHKITHRHVIFPIYASKCFFLSITALWWVTFGDFVFKIWIIKNYCYDCIVYSLAFTLLIREV